MYRYRNIYIYIYIFTYTWLNLIVVIFPQQVQTAFIKVSSRISMVRILSIRRATVTFLNAQNNQSGLEGVSTSETMGWIYFPFDGGRTEGGNPSKFTKSTELAHLPYAVWKWSKLYFLLSSPACKSEQTQWTLTVPPRIRQKKSRFSTQTATATA